MAVSDPSKDANKKPSASQPAAAASQTGAGDSRIVSIFSSLVSPIWQGPYRLNHTVWAIRVAF